MYIRCLRYPFPNLVIRYDINAWPEIYGEMTDKIFFCLRMREDRFEVILKSGGKELPLGFLIFIFSFSNNILRDSFVFLALHDLQCIELPSEKVFGFPTKSATYWAVQPQKMARRLEFRR